MALDSQAAVQPGGAVQISLISATSVAVSVPGGPVVPGGKMFLTSDSGAYVQDGTYYVPETIQTKAGQLAFQLLVGSLGGPFTPQATPLPVASGTGAALGLGTPLATSQDGSSVWVAAPNGSAIYESGDAGATWSQSAPAG